MKKGSFRKSLMAIGLGLALSSVTTSAFAAAYHVQPNDTLVKIAQKKGVSLYKLIRLNPQIVNPNIIYPGMSIQLPGKTYYPPVSQAPASKPATVQPIKQTTQVGTFSKEVLSLVNQQRSKAGLTALRLDSNLSAMAMDKALDMAKNNYFDHTSPTYGSPFDMMKKYGIPFGYAGENIAMGQQSPQQVMNDWMNSAGHRANILNSHYDTIGLAYYNGYWVQEFTGKGY